MAEKKDPRVSSLVIKRSKNDYKASWKVPSAMKSKVDGLRFRWLVNRVGVKDSWGSKDLSKDATSAAIQFKRSSYWPYTKTKVSAVQVKVAGVSGKSVLDARAESYEFAVPRRPKVTSAFDAATGTVTWTVKTDAGNDRYERYDTAYEVYRTDWKTKRKLIASKKSSTATSFQVTTTLSDWAGLMEGQWIEVELVTWSRGIAGSSEPCAQAACRRVFARPAVAEITSEPKVSGGQVIVNVRTNRKAHAPVDEVQLLRYVGSAIEPNASKWTEVKGSVDDGDCTALHDSVPDATPSESGQHVWYRLRTTHDTYVMYSEPWECTALQSVADTSSASVAKVLSATSSGDGSSAVVTVGWEDDQTHSYDGTRVSWSTDQDAWRSTKSPESFDMPDADWADGTAVSGDVTLTTASVKVMGLEDGCRYFFRARRYNSSTGSEGALSVPVPCMVTSIPASPVLSAPSSVASGAPFDVSWSSSATQAAWELDEVEVDGDGKVTRRMPIARGDGSASSATVDSTRLSGGASARLLVQVSDGGDFADSNHVVVAVVTPPSVSVAADEVITAAGHAVAVSVAPSGATVSLRLVADGVANELPDGQDTQFRGDVVWQGDVSGEVGEDGAATVAIPEGTHLVDGASYVLEAVPTIDGVTGEAASMRMSVSWGHQAVAAASCEMKVDSDAMSVTLKPQEPSGYAEGDSLAQSDVFDVYRLTPDGSYEIARGVPFGCLVTDRWAPFGDESAHAYRVATRTAEGDVDWQDFPYALPGSHIRIDWAGRHVDLPHNVRLGDRWSKGFEARSYVDQEGQSGYWSGGTSRTSSQSATVIRVMEPEALEALRSLATHEGPALVRTPDGCAFEANVDVSSLDASWGSMLASVSLSVTEVAPGTYVCDDSDVYNPNASQEETGTAGGGE